MYSIRVMVSVLGPRMSCCPFPSFSLLLHTPVVLLCLFLAHCRPPSFRPDATTADAMDAPTDSPPPIDAPACNGPNIEDLATIATRDQAGLRYIGTNAHTPDALTDALQPGRACPFRAVHQRLFRYTMQTTAALRVSTNNPGTTATFDTTLFVVELPCTVPPRVLACNDDDPFAPRNPPVMASLVTTPVLPAGTQVLIAVSGFYPAFGSGQEPDPRSQTGDFELTVREITPLEPGTPCDPRGMENICPNGYHCIAESIAGERWTCQADGSAPGTTCSPGGTCNPPLQCDTDQNQCYELVPFGAGCDRVGIPRQRCAPGLSCVSRVRGAARGTCIPDGSVPLSACLEGNYCTQGLTCRNGTCVQQIEHGGLCNTTDSACPEGETCVPFAPGAFAGRCTPDGTAPGTACRPGAVECDEPLFCITNRWVDRLCRTVGREPGAPCGPLGACSYDNECIAFDPTRPYQGTCTPPGALGGPCRSTGSPCDPGLSCTDPTMRPRGRCLLTAMENEPCDLAARSIRCTTGTTCVRQGTTGDMGICLRHGTAAGTACRSTTPRCDRGLVCSSDSGAGICQRNTTDGTCDPRFLTVRCPTGTVCRAIGLEQGTCTTTTPEREPNDSVPGVPTDTPVALEGSLTRYDVDCIAVNVPERGTVFAQAVSLAGTCTANLAIDLYSPDSRPLGTDADSGPASCPRIDGNAPDFPWARQLPAGRYTVCVREAGDRRPVTGYVLSVHTGP